MAARRGSVLVGRVRSPSAGGAPGPADGPVAQAAQGGGHKGDRLGDEQGRRAEQHRDQQLVAQLVGEGTPATLGRKSAQASAPTTKASGGRIAIAPMSSVCATRAAARQHEHEDDAEDAAETVAAAVTVVRAGDRGEQHDQRDGAEAGEAAAVSEAQRRRWVRTGRGARGLRLGRHLRLSWTISRSGVRRCGGGKLGGGRDRHAGLVLLVRGHGASLVTPPTVVRTPCLCGEPANGAREICVVTGVPSRFLSAVVPTVSRMRLLHTSDWHLGRSFHGVDLVGAQAAMVDGLIDVVRSERVDAVLVAGDLYDRALPPVDAVELWGQTLERLTDAGAAVVVISGNHDSARRLAGGARLLERARCTSAPTSRGPPSR